MIARFEGEHLTDSQYAFLSLVYPAAPGQQPPEVTAIRSEIITFDQIRFYFTVGQTDYSLLLRDNRLTVESHEAIS